MEGLEMRAEELMIGDWVQVSHVDKIGKIYRIDAANGIGNEYAAVIDGDFDCADLRPISLTPEILEKNGFKKENGGKIMGFNIADSYKLVYQGRTNFDKFWINIQDFGESKKWYIKINGHFDISGYINDVHELQHALKLCGINIEIEL